MQALLVEMRRAMMNEYKRIAEKYGAGFHSTHEAWAVTKEEVDEAVADLLEVCDWMDKIWDCVKRDLHSAPAYKSMRDAALEAAAECIQVAACCDKALRSEGVVRG